MQLSIVALMALPCIPCRRDHCGGRFDSQDVFTEYDLLPALLVQPIALGVGQSTFWTNHYLED